MRAITRLFLLLSLACALNSVSFAVTSLLEVPEAKNFRLLLEGNSKQVPVHVEALVSLNDGFQKGDQSTQINVQITKDATGKCKVRLNFQNVIKVSEGQAMQAGLSVAYYFKPEFRTMVVKSEDSELYLTIKEE